MKEGFHVEDHGPVRRITLDRPECKNGLTPAIAEGLTDAIHLSRDKRVIVLAGKNGAFCSGLDLRVAIEMGPQLLANAEEHLAGFQRLADAVARCNAIVVAAVDGPAAGFGCDLALAADLRIASERAFFQHSFSKIGLIPDGGGTWLLPRLVGLSKALEMTLLSERIDANTAKDLGLVTKVVSVDSLAAELDALVERLAGGPPMAFQRIKRLMRESMSKPWAQGQADEGQGQLECLRSQDCIEGIMAFFEKRAPLFKGE